jgi:hypothetical protein
LRPGNAADPAMVSFQELQEIVGFPAYWERETQYRAAD